MTEKTQTSILNEGRPVAKTCQPAGCLAHQQQQLKAKGRVNIFEGFEKMCQHYMFFKTNG